MQEQPKILYKYRDWKNEKHRKIITDREIYFTSIKNFNDPFDCKIPLRYDLLTRWQWYNKTKNLMKEEYSNWSKVNIKKGAKFWMSLGKYTDKETVDKFIKDEIQLLESEFGIFSLSCVKDNILMWSHYSNSHSGICVGFNVKNLMQNLSNYTNNNLFFELKKVNYVRKYPKIIPYHQNTEIFYNKRLFYKSSFWEYEQEYRILSFFEAADKKYVVSEDTFTEVILGFNMPRTTRLELAEYTTKELPHVKLYETEMSKEKFKINLKRIF